MNSKIYIGNVQPNPKEFKVWIDDEGVIKTFDGQKWNKIEGGSSNEGDGSGDTQPAPAEKITFVVVDDAGTETTYTAEKGMTWKEFGESQYNVDAWVIVPEGFVDNYVYIDYIDRGGWSGGESNSLTYLPPDSGVYTGLYENMVNVNDFIIANHRYGNEYDGWGIGGGVGM